MRRKGATDTLFVNDRPVGRLQATQGTLAGAISIVRVPIPEGALQVRENRVEIVQRECAVTRGQDRLDAALIRSVLLRMPWRQRSRRAVVLIRAGQRLATRSPASAP